MSLADVMRLVMRTAHLGAMSVWFGGGLLYLLSRSTPRSVANGETAGAYGQLLRTLIGRSFAVLVASGAYLIFDRLSNPRLGITYILVLAVKLALVVTIAWTVGIRRQRVAVAQVRPRWRDPGWIALVLGAGALILGVALTLIYEAEARTF